MLRVAFIDFLFENRSDIHLDGCEFTIHGILRTTDEIAAAAGDADVLCMRDQFASVTPELFDRLPNLKLLVTRSAGYEHIDLGEAERRGIPVCNVPDYGAHMIAELAFGLLLAVARNIVRGHRRYEETRRFSDQGLGGVELYGKTLGVVGAGRIGRHAIRIGNGFGMRVLAYDTAESEAASRQLNFTYTPMAKLLSESDFVTLHVNLNESTRHLIDAGRLAQMKTGAILINTSRGSVVDTNAVIDSLRSGHLGGAGLDVLEDERETYHDFSGLNVVVTPHLGWYTDGAVNRLMQITLEDIAAYRRGQIVNQVN